jgi:Fe-S cluster assembly scaffold protein SufB
MGDWYIEEMLKCEANAKFLFENQTMPPEWCERNMPYPEVLGKARQQTPLTVALTEAEQQSALNCYNDMGELADYLLRHDYCKDRPPFARTIDTAIAVIEEQARLIKRLAREVDKHPVDHGVYY